MSTVDDIKQARTVQEALVILATAIDELRQPADPWAEPLFWGETDPDPKPLVHEAVAIKTQLAECTDPDERRALEARLRLANDTGRALAPAVVPGERAVVEAEFTPGNLRPTQAIAVGGNDVELPVPTPDQRVARFNWAGKRKLWDFIPMTPSDAVDNFAKGGPMWLYLGNRDAVMAMPIEWRRELVQMVAEDDEAQAQRVGRDILKIADSPDKDMLRA